MGCQVEQTEQKIIHDHQSCIICRDHPHNFVPVTGGVIYPKCSVLINGATPFAPKELLTDLATQADRIYGIVTCAQDFSGDTTAELAAANVKIAALTTGDFDPYYVCWPEGTTKAMVDAYACQAACCLRFRWRTHCTDLPEQYQYLLEAVGLAELKKTQIAQAAGVKRAASAASSSNQTQNKTV